MSQTIYFLFIYLYFLLKNYAWSFFQCSLTKNPIQRLELLTKTDIRFI